MFENVNWGAVWQSIIDTGLPTAIIVIVIITIVVVIRKNKRG